MANIIQQKFGTAAPASNALAKGELAIRFVAADHTASSSSKLYFGEGNSANLRQFGFGIAGDSGQHGIAIGENFTITGGNALTTEVDGDEVTINHDDTSSQSSVNNSGQNFIQDITLDTYGHVTGITSATASGSSGIALTDLSVGSEGSASGDGAIAYNNSSGVFTYTPPVHDSLSGFVSNEHIDHSGVSVTAGDGLTGGGTIASSRTLNVVGGTGITANANDIQITNGGVDTTQLADDAVTTAKINDGDVTNAKLAGSIDDSKLNQITTQNKVHVSSLDIDGATDIGEALVDADLFIVDNGANSTERKATMSRLKTYIENNIGTLNQDTTGTATNANHVKITDNESTNESNQITFIEGAGGGTAFRGLEADGDFTYNPNTSTVSAGNFDGNLTIGNHTLNDVDITSEFVDSDEHLMTAKAINNRIQDFGYVTDANVTHRTITAGGNTLANGEALDFVAGSGISISESGGDVTIAASGGGGSTSPGGSDTEVQFNNGGSFGGDSKFTWDDTTLQISTTTSDEVILRLLCTDNDQNHGPVMDFRRDSSSPADGDELGRIRFIGDNSNGSQRAYAAIFAECVDVTNATDDGRLAFSASIQNSHDELFYAGSQSTSGNPGVYPNGDDNIDLGNSSNGWQSVYGRNFYGHEQGVGYQAGVTDGMNFITGNSIDVTVSTAGGIVFAVRALNLSDENLKDNISQYTTGLSMINQLTPKSFTIKDKVGTSVKDRTGFIAQDLEKISSDYVEESNYTEGDTKFLALSQKFNDELIAAQINAIKELSAKNDALEARIAALEAK